MSLPNKILSHDLKLSIPQIPKSHSIDFAYLTSCNHELQSALKLEILS